jgi:hypothetical protein
MGGRITEAELRDIEAADAPILRESGLAGRRIADEIRRLRGLLLRVGTIRETQREPLAALAARYGVDHAQAWDEVLREIDAIRKEQQG